MKHLFLSLGIAALLMPNMVKAKDVTIVVTNSERTQRQEIVEVKVQDVYNSLGIDKNKTFVVKNAMGHEVDYQITYDGLLLIDASVRPCGEAIYTVSLGTPQKPKVFVTGRQYPERVDDIAWENDRTA